MHTCQLCVWVHCDLGHGCLYSFAGAGPPTCKQVGNGKSVSFSVVQIYLFPGNQPEFQPFWLALGTVQLLVRCCSCPCTCGGMKEEIQDGDILWPLAFKAVHLMTRWQKAG